jgi:hypothetical protein
MLLKMKPSNLLFLLFGVVLFACKKQDITIPAEQAHFTNQTSGNYTMANANTTFKIPIGLTSVSSSPRTVNITVTSPTGAVQGTHYTLSTSSLVIPAGKAVDSIEVKGVFSQYTTGRKDVLVFKIEETGAGVKGASYNNTYTLNLRGPCFEGAVTLSDFLGEYKKTNETWATGPYGPYTTRVSAVNPLTATTGTITVENLFNAGWSPLTFTLDWTDPNNRRVTLVTQNAGGDAGSVFGATYNGQPFGVRPVPASAGGEVGTFSICNQTIQLKMQIGIFGVAYHTAIYTVNMAR